MTSEQYKQVKEVFHAALERQSSERAEFLSQRCNADEDVIREVQSLLQSHEHAGQFIEKSAFEAGARLLTRDSTDSFEGKRLGQYRLIRRIGSGGMGLVYLAERADEQFQKQVAIKIVRTGLDSAETQRRFRYERQILATLDHSNIAKLLDAGVTETGLPYLVMDYVEGVPITEYCEQHGLSATDRLNLFRIVCSAVQFAHQRLVIHRDIKPGNIIVTDEGTPKLLDFGIAKLLDPALTDATGKTQTGIRVMTPEYASPEQIRDQEVTTATDVYSLGVLLYELLTGARPYRLSSPRPDDIARAVQDQEPAKPSQAVLGRVKSVMRNGVRADLETAKSTNRPVADGKRPVPTEAKLLRGDLDNIVLMAMRKEPERRYASVQQFSDDLRRHLEGLPVIARKDTISYRSLKFVRRHRLGVAATAIVLMALIAGVTATAWQARVARRQRDAARAAQVKAERLNQFLQRMLSFSNQSVTSVSPVAQRRDVTVNEMLAQITPQVEAELADQPDVRAQVLRTIGSAYASQGQYEAAERNLRAALDVQTRLSGETNAEAAGTMVELGVLSFRQQRFDEASQLLNKAVAFYRSQKQAQSPDYSAAKLALAVDYLGVVKYYQGDSKSSLAFLEEALQISSGANLQGTERRVLTFNKSDFGGVLIGVGEFQKGESLLRAAEAEYRQMSTRPPWELGSTLLLLGIASLNKNQLEEAEKFLRESEEIFRQTLGNDNWYLAQTLDRQAAALYRKNDLKSAEQKVLESLTMAQKISPDNKLTWVNPMWTLGDILTKAGRAREGEDYYRQALAIWEQQQTKNHVFITQLKIRLSQSLLAQRRLPEAERLAREARDEATQFTGEQSPVSKAASENLIKISAGNGRTAKG